MGSGSKKGHESFSVTPADTTAVAPVPSPAMEPVTAGDEGIFNQYVTDEDIAGISGASTFTAMSAAVASAQGTLANADQQPAELQMPQLAAESNKAIHTASKDWLDGKSKAELEQMAAEAGFPHPQMVSEHALKAWLDPSYSPDAEYKAKIAAKSVERYNAAVAAGEIVPPIAQQLPEGSWSATPAEVLEAQSAFWAAAGKVQPKASWQGAQPAGIADFKAMIDAENKLATAHCPELGESLAAAQAQAKQLVDDRSASHNFVGKALVHDMVASGELPENAKLLNAPEALQLARASTPDEQKALLNNTIAQRAGIVADMTAAKETLTGFYGGQYQHGGKPSAFTSPTDVVTYNAAAKAYRESLAKHQSWGAVAAIPVPYINESDLAGGLRHGAKTLSMDQLRDAAKTQGLADPTGASRAQLQNWMIGQWSNDYDSAAIAAEIAAKKAQPQPKPQPAPTPKPAAAPKATPSATPAAASASTSSNSGSPSSVASVTPISPTAGSGKWFAKQQQMVAALKHQAASLADVPVRPAAADVAGWTFNKGPSMNLGGAHTKEVVSAPDGSLWMFKPTKDPYRSLSESGANGILHRAGIPTVPVYARKYEGQHGTVQPLMKGATTFPSSPSEWSQSDVDAIVRYHAAAWLVGDHDAKYDNLLRTPSGGVVPIDHGQAFKFWGQDKLSPDFHPNASFGSKPPVWNVLYAAAKNGELASGVKIRPAAALPVIKSIESISDGEFKAMIEPSAKAGAASGSSSHWRSVFEKRAASKHGGSASSQQIADEFVAYGIERKNGVRKAFMNFFAAAGVGGSDVLSKVA